MMYYVCILILFHGAYLCNFNKCQNEYTKFKITFFGAYKVVISIFALLYKVMVKWQPPLTC